MSRIKYKLINASKSFFKISKHNLFNFNRTHILGASIIGLYLFSSHALGSTKIELSKNLKKQYEDFQKSYSQILDLSKNKKNFLKDFEQNTKNLKNKYTAYTKTEKSMLTEDGHQMALDIEMLEPLVFLASSRVDKESCAEADLLNEMNSSSDTQTY